MVWETTLNRYTSVDIPRKQDNTKSKTVDSILIRSYTAYPLNGKDDSPQLPLLDVAH
jgi:hypothetical protein